MSHVLCVDVGSTFTKAVLVDTQASDPWVSTAAVPTTNPLMGAGGDVMEGVDAVAAQLAAQCSATIERVLVCSSAGGGLRIAVVGYEEVVTAEAGRRAALTAGGRVVHVHAGRLNDYDMARLREARPDLVLLVGGTNGGNSEVLLHNAMHVAQLPVGIPVVAAGNDDAAEALQHIFQAAQHNLIVADNVLPEIGTYAPDGARAAIRQAFLAHVIGGKGLSTDDRFAQLVLGATPDIVFSGVEVLADGEPGVTQGVGDVLVVDVGGATTDVYSVLHPEGEDAVIVRDAVAPAWRLRTVEGDLGMRWSAPGVVEAADAEGLLADDERSGLVAAAASRAHDPGQLFLNAQDVAMDGRIAELAVTVALRRHARPMPPSLVGRDLRNVVAVIGSGGVMRHYNGDVPSTILRPAVTDHAGGWRVPRSPSMTVDTVNRLLAAGLVAGLYPGVATRLVAPLASGPQPQPLDSTAAAAKSN